MFRARRYFCRPVLPGGRPRRSQIASNRRGAAVVELAILLPLLAFLFFVAVDFARVYYYSLTVQNCARAGALYAMDPYVSDESPFANVEECALSDAANLSPTPKITSGTGTDLAGRVYVEVTATYPFQSVTRFPGIPNPLDVTRTVRMYKAAIKPNTN